MKKAILAMIITGSCFAGEAVNYNPNIVPQQQILLLMTARAALNGQKSIITQECEQTKLLKQSKGELKQPVYPKNQKFPKQKKYTIQQSR